MANIYVIIGEDDFLVDETARKLIPAEAGLEVVDSLNSSNAELQLHDLSLADSSLSTPPFLEPSKVTWWRNVHFLPHAGGRSASEEVKVALERFARRLVAAKLPENQKFILSAPRLLKTSIVAKTLSGGAELVEFASGRRTRDRIGAAMPRVLEYAKELGLDFASGGASAFVARVGPDTRSLVSELRKVREYLGAAGHTITGEVVAAVVSQGVGLESEVWSVTDPVGMRDVVAAVKALRQFESESGFAVFMSTVLERFFRDLAELKDAQLRDRLDEATKSMPPFVVSKNRNFLRGWSLNELRIARYRFLALREKAVSSDGDVGSLVVAELVNVCRRKDKGGQG